MTSDASGAERHRGREAALQLLYQWEVCGLDRASLQEASGFYWSVHPGPKVRRLFAESLAVGTVEQIEKIDPLLESRADNWRLSRMAVVDRLIMRMAVYEFLCSDNPAPVIIDEALELARTYGGEQAVSFVNGVLDNVYRTLVNSEDPIEE